MYELRSEVEAERDKPAVCIRNVCRHSSDPLKQRITAARVLVQTTTRKCTAIISC